MMIMNKKIYGILGAIVACVAGVVVASCDSSARPVGAATVSASPSAGLSFAPFVLSGKTLVLDHSQAESARLVMTGEVDNLADALGWQSAKEYGGEPWPDSIPFSANAVETEIKMGEVEKMTFVYSKISDTDAIITSTYYSEDGTVYPSRTMKLKFISPMEAVATYDSCYGDDTHYYRNVRVFIK